MTNTALFREVVRRAGLKYQYLASLIGITPYGLSLKIKNINEFRASEIATLSEALGLSSKEKEDIFFARQGD